MSFFLLVKKKPSIGEILLILILSGLGVVEKGDLFPELLCA